MLRTCYSLGELLSVSTNTEPWLQTAVWPGARASDGYRVLPLQVTHLEVLAKLYILRYQYADAAAVYQTLAVRKQGLGSKAVDLSERVEYYRSAVLQALPCHKFLPVAVMTVWLRLGGDWRIRI